ncbi:MAG: sialate O-acetylesterase [Pirellulaceae bacterium]
MLRNLALSCSAAIAVLSILLLTNVASAELKLSPVFGDHMVLQRDKPIHVWGWTKPGQEVTIKLSDKAASGTADDTGRFDVSIDALSAGGPHEMTVAADETRVYKDILIGEVWVCSGQSNMAWQVSNANDADLESMTAKFPNLRLISVPQVGSQEPQNDFNGKWEACTPESVKTFSAVGYFFGRQLHQSLDVPVGLIDNAWGGSSAEAWVRRDVLESAGSFDELLKKWDDTAATYDHEAAVAQWNERLAKWKETKKGPQPRQPRDILAGQHRPANLYNGVLMPILGYTIRGTVWYQGESNAGRAYQYRELFPLMIQNWRDDWKQGDFSFYWVQLADFRDEVNEPGDSDWAELREAQTMTMSKLPATGEAVIVDLGEASDIHPKNKQIVGKRLARWALAKDYGIDIPYRSPTYKTLKISGDKALLTFDHVGAGLDTFDVNRPVGFTIAGDDGKFVRADAKIVGKNQVQVWSEQVSEPTAVRYAWANNPICNVQSKEGLPMTPFRTDDRPGVTQGVVK